MDSGWGRRKGKGGYRHQGHQTKTGFPSPSSQKRFKMIISWHFYNFDINFVSNVPLRSIIYYQLCILLLVQQKICWGFEKLLPLSEPCMQHQNIASHAAEIYNQSRLVSNIVKTRRLEMETLESSLSDDFNFIKLYRSDNHRGHASNCRALWRRILSIVSLLGGNIQTSLKQSGFSL